MVNEKEINESYLISCVLARAVQSNYKPNWISAQGKLKKENNHFGF